MDQVGGLPRRPPSHQRGTPRPQVFADLKMLPRTHPEKRASSLDEREHEPRNAATEAIQVAYPVARFGTFMGAIDSDHKTRVLTDAENESVAASLRSSDLSEDIRRCISSVDVRDSVAQHRHIDVAVTAPKLRVTRRRSGLDLGIDLDEFVICLNGAEVVVRSCISLSSAGAFSSSKASPKTKFWTRFILAKHPRSPDNTGKRAIGLKYDVIKSFMLDCESLSDIIFKCIEGRYKDILSNVICAPTQLVREGLFSVLALETRGPDFAVVLSEATGGRSLESLVQAHPTAVALTKLGLRVLADRDGKLPEKSKMVRGLPEGTRFLIFNRTRGERGLFLAKFTEHKARFVGLSQMPEAFEPFIADVHDLVNLSRLSANTVSAGLTSEYEAHFP